MANFQITAVPTAQWQLQFLGSQDVAFNGQLMQSCLQAMVECADKSGCLQDGKVHLTALCAQTLAAHHLATG